MSRHEVDVVNCDHEYAVDKTDEKTGDTVLSCCRCDEVLAPLHDGELPAHWFDHEPRVGRESIKLSLDILNGEFFESTDERFIHICGACGHWLNAVHGSWFENYSSAREINEIESGFVGGLKETLCPSCGAACFRQGSIVAPLSVANLIRNEPELNAARYVFNRADKRIWQNSVGSYERNVELSWKMQSALHDHGYLTRCPACGFAERYGNFDREFDFHHWDYDEDIGCCLCRECHTDIHDDMTATEQSESTGRGWQYDAITRLHNVSRQNGLEFGSKEAFITRYNIPDTGVTAAAVDEVFDDE
jgi:uncharacterized C2H2 Zn-finger protein